jgi:hypothetical protein
MPDEALYDVFMSHSHQDAEAVEALARWLRAEAGLSVWLDRWVPARDEPLAARILREDVPNG